MIAASRRRVWRLAASVVVALLVASPPSSAQVAGPQWQLAGSRVLPRTVNVASGGTFSSSTNTLTISGGAGSVSSVGLTAPTIFSVAGSPVTGSGTLALTLNTQTANLFLAGPSSGAAAIPTFRLLAAADLPGGGTLAATYANGTSQASSTMTLDATRLGLVAKDSVAGVGSLLTLQNNVGTTDYLKISDNATQIYTSGAVGCGAGVKAHVFNTSTAYAAIDNLLEIQNNNVPQWHVEGGFGYIVADSPGFGLQLSSNNLLSFIRVDDPGGASLQSGSDSVRVSPSGGIINKQGSGMLTFFAPSLLPFPNLTLNLGDQGDSFASVWSRRYAGVQPAIAFSATPTFDVTTGESFHFGPVTANVTGATLPALSAGYPGETITIIAQKDATAGTFTFTFAGANVHTLNAALLAGTFAAGALSFLIMVFRWDATAAVWIQSNSAKAL